MHPYINRNSPECGLKVGVGHAAHDLQSHTPHFVVSLMTNWSISEDKPPTEAWTEGNYLWLWSCCHERRQHQAPPRDYEAGTVGGRVTVTTTSALVIIDSTTTRWKATRTGSLFEVLGIEWSTQNLESLLMTESSRQVTTFRAVWGARNWVNNSKLREPLNDGIK